MDLHGRWVTIPLQISACSSTPQRLSSWMSSEPRQPTFILALSTCLPSRVSASISSRKPNLETLSSSVDLPHKFGNRSSNTQEVNASENDKAPSSPLHLLNQRPNESSPALHNSEAEHPLQIQFRGEFCQVSVYRPLQFSFPCAGNYQTLV